MKTLLVIDMLKDFIEASGALYCGDESRRIIPFIKEKIEEFHRLGDLVIFVKDSHREDDLEFKMFPRHCVRGTRGAEIIDELPVEAGDIIVEKTRYSAFYGTSLNKILKDRAITEAHVVGVCTSICVMDTVGDLRDRDYPVVVYKEGMADFDSEAHRFSLRRMEKTYGATVR
jgi:nicotinamidase/pyrazinamidase